MVEATTRSHPLAGPCNPPPWFLPAPNGLTSRMPITYTQDWFVAIISPLAEHLFHVWCKYGPLIISSILSLLWDIFITSICLPAIWELKMMWQILHRCLTLLHTLCGISNSHKMDSQWKRMSVNVHFISVPSWKLEKQFTIWNKIDQTSLTSLECIEQSINFEAHIVIALRRMIVELRQWGLELGKESIKLFVFYLLPHIMI